jgi:SSS family solute:Na+ symporter
VVVGLVFIPRIKKAGISSAYELFEKQFSSGVRRLAAIFYSMHLLLRMGILLYAPSLVLAPIVGVDIHVAILITAIVATAYTWYGGFKAVVWTDVLQFGVLFGGGVVTLLIIAHAVGGFGTMYTLASEAEKTVWFNASDWNPANARNLLSAGFVYAVIEIAIRGCDQQFVQRYLSCKSVTEANSSSILSMVLGIFVSVLFFWVGAGLYVFYQVKGIEFLPPGTAVNEVFPYFIVNVLPPGVTGLVVAAIYAAAMSSLSSAINALGNTTVKDIMLIRDESAASLAKAKMWTLLWALLSTGCAFIAVDMKSSLLSNALFFTGLFTGPLLALFLLAFFSKRISSITVICAVLCGMASILLFNRIPFFPGYEAPFAGTLSFFWNPLLSCSMTILCANIFRFIFPRSSRAEVL